MTWNYDLSEVPEYELVAVLLKPWRSGTYTGCAVWAADRLHDPNEPAAGCGVWLRGISSDETVSETVIAWAPLPEPESWVSAEAKFIAARRIKETKA